MIRLVLATYIPTYLPTYHLSNPGGLVSGMVGKYQVSSIFHDESDHIQMGSKIKKEAL